MNGINEWVAIRDLIQIRKYGFLRHLKYLFNYSKTVVYVQVDLAVIPLLPDISPFTTRELNFEDRTDLEIWAEIINVAYGEEQYDAVLAKKKLKEHEFLDVHKVFLIFDGPKCIGTVSAAAFKSNPKIASGCRFAVHPQYQGRGLGKYLYLLIMHHLRDQGYRFFESTMAIKRKTSFIVKFKLGFYPQFNRKYVQYKGQRRFFLIRWFANYQLYRLWRDHRKRLNEQFVSS
jgi:GNAT superfamily N-acetyltransferase